MPDPTYGTNEDSRPDMCPRFANAVPVFFREIISRDNIHGEQLLIEVHCLKCDDYGRKDGTLIQQRTRGPQFKYNHGEKAVKVTKRMYTEY